MLGAYTAGAIYDAEAPALAAGVPLMARAARGLADAVIAETRRGAAIAVFAGRGNNGADALYAAGHIAQAGRRVTAMLAFDETDAPAVTRAAVAAATGAGVEVRRAGAPAAQGLPAEVTGADAWVDGLTGIGMRPPARGRVGDLLAALAGHRARSGRSAPVVFAVDLPSGLGADTGEVCGPVLEADHTVTFGGYKAAHFLPPAADACGRVRLVDIGIGPALEQQTPAVRRLGPEEAFVHAPGAADHKYTRGVLGLVTGSTQYPGAAVLSAAGALGCGPGMVRYLGEVPEQVLAAHPEVVHQPGRVQAWAVGSGISGRASTSAAAVERALTEGAAAGVPVVVDAGALEWVGPGTIAGEPTSRRIVLTPHAGELAALLARCGVEVDRPAIEADPARWAGTAHEVTGASIVLKGGTTLAVIEGELYSQDDGTPWLATAGTGDVLTGILAAVLAGWQARTEQEGQGEFAAAVLTGVMLHGRAGRRASGGGPLRAGEIAHALPGVITELLAH